MSLTHDGFVARMQKIENNIGTPASRDQGKQSPLQAKLDSQHVDGCTKLPDRRNDGISLPQTRTNS
jgi:hypothetical protein